VLWNVKRLEGERSLEVFQSCGIWEYLTFVLGKEMAIRSSTLAWKIPWTEDPGRDYSPWGRRVGHDWVTSLSFPFLCLCLGLSSFSPKVFLPMLPTLILKTSMLLLEGMQKAYLCACTLVHTPGSHLESGVAGRTFGHEFLRFISAFRFHSESIPVSFLRY